MTRLVGADHTSARRHPQKVRTSVLREYAVLCDRSLFESRRPSFFSLFRTDRRTARRGHIHCSTNMVMEVRDGFIVGIFNYCDSWCDTCAFTSHCRVFADSCELEAAHDPGLRPIVDAPRLESELPPPPPPWFQGLLNEANEAVKQPELLPVREKPRLPAAHEQIERRADVYDRRARLWLRPRESEAGAPGDPLSVIAWFHMLIHVKIMRALHGLAEGDSTERDWPADHDGSAKVALIGMDRSQSAWLDLVECGRASVTEAAPFIEDLVWLTDALERTFPNARAFVRPGFDEPEEVAKLLAAGSE